MPDEHAMAPVRLNKEIYAAVEGKRDPAFRELTAGLSAGILELIKDPGRTSISCCIEGCCVSWCCIQLS